jgi:AGZA family xanthine/uracil permease-like MFS transporter
MAAAFAGAGAMLTFFGFMHGPEVGFAVTPLVAASYAIVAGVRFACAKYAEIEVAEPEGEALSATAAPAE